MRWPMILLAFLGLGDAGHAQRADRSDSDVLNQQVLETFGLTPLERTAPERLRA